MGYIKKAAQYTGLVLLGIGGMVVASFWNALINALGVWIVLEQFDYSLPGGFWSYIFAGFGLAIIVATPEDK